MGFVGNYVPRGLSPQTHDMPVIQRKSPITEHDNGRLKMVFVRLKGLEPPRLSSLDPKSSAATNYATAAKGVQRYNYF